ncbi:hypothetical protein D3C79_211200 [compost metagenome]
MTARKHFLKKLQAQQSSGHSFTSRSQADIAAFRQGMAQLQENMVGWLADTGLQPENSRVSLSDLLVEAGAFDVPGITLRYENRTIKFTPLFLYGHGVTGCVEVGLYAEGKVAPLGRLFMRAGHNTHWTCARPETLSRPEHAFDEDAFFGMLESLLP